MPVKEEIDWINGGTSIYPYGGISIIRSGLELYLVASTNFLDVMLWEKCKFQKYI